MIKQNHQTQCKSIDLCTQTGIKMVAAEQQQTTGETLKPKSTEWGSTAM